MARIAMGQPAPRSDPISSKARSVAIDRENGSWESLETTHQGAAACSKGTPRPTPSWEKDSQ
jgi:hypothetical protein